MLVRNYLKLKEYFYFLAYGFITLPGLQSDFLDSLALMFLLDKSNYFFLARFWLYTLVV